MEKWEVTMTRNSIQLLGEMKVGDRFHYPGKDKTVYELIDKNETAVYVNRPALLPDKYLDRHPTRVDSGTEVVFLRSTK
jgi:hypothetical protein